jgi:hypothetical protein
MINVVVVRAKNASLDEDSSSLALIHAKVVLCVDLK